MYTTRPHLYEELSDDYLRATKKNCPADRPSSFQPSNGESKVSSRLAKDSKTEHTYRM